MYWQFITSTYCIAAYRLLYEKKVMHNITFICVHKINVLIPPLSEGAYILEAVGAALNILRSSNIVFPSRQESYHSSHIFNIKSYNIFSVICVILELREILVQITL